MSSRKVKEHQTFSNIVLSRNINLTADDKEAVAIYFAFESVHSPRLETKYAKKYEQGKQFVSNLINTLDS